MRGHADRRAQRALSVRVEALEPREVPSTSNSSYSSAIAKHAYDEFVAELQRIELNSQATPAEYLALRDDTRAISGAVSASGTAANVPSTSNRLVAATLLIDRSLLQGWLSQEGWNEIRGNLADDLAPFHVAPALLDKTVADMTTAAQSAAVDPGAEQVLLSDIASVQSARNQLYGGSPSASYRDPQVYYTQHLRGFFRGWAQQRTSDAEALHADLASIANGSGGVLNRDVALLQQLGAAIPSNANQTLTEASITLVNGPHDSAGQSGFQTTAIAALGGTATSHRIVLVNRLSADASAFATAAGSSANVQTIITAVRATVNDGQGAALNPFLIVRYPAVSTTG